MRILRSRLLPSLFLLLGLFGRNFLIGQEEPLPPQVESLIDSVIADLEENKDPYATIKQFRKYFRTAKQINNALEKIVNLLDKKELSVRESQSIVLLSDQLLKEADDGWLDKETAIQLSNVGRFFFLKQLVEKVHRDVDTALNRNNFDSAVNIVRSGYADSLATLYEGSGTEAYLDNETRTRLTSIVSLTETYFNQYIQLKDKERSQIPQLKLSRDISDAAFFRAIDSLKDLEEFHFSLLGRENSIKDLSSKINSQLTRNGSPLTQSYFLRGYELLLIGRDGTAKSGFWWVANQFNVEEMRALSDWLVRIIQSDETEMYKRLGSDNLSQINAFSSSIDKRVARIQGMNSLWEERLNRKRNSNPPEYNEKQREGDLGYLKKLQVKSRELAFYHDFIDIKNQLAKVSSEKDDDIEKIIKTLSLLGDINATLARIKETLQPFPKENVGTIYLSYNLLDKDYSKIASSYYLTHLNVLETYLTGVVAKVKESQDRIETNLKQLDKAVSYGNFLEGTNPQIKPSYDLSIFLDELNENKKQSQNLTRIIGLFKDADFRGDRERIDAFVKKAEKENITSFGRNEKLIATSSETLQAISSQKEVIRLNLRRADDLIAQSNYARASDLLVASQQLAFYDYSEKDQDEELKEWIFTSIPKKLADLSAIRSREVIDKVTELLEQTEGFFNNKEFSLSYRTALQASNLWNSFYPQANPEVEYWINLTKNALNATIGLEFDPYAPSYREMVQYYNFAEEDFEDAKKNRREDRKEAQLESALEKLQLILVLYPRNVNAKILEFRIIKESSVEEYERAFSSSLASSRDLLDLDDRQAQGEAFGRLKVFMELEPDNKEVKDLYQRSLRLLGIVEKVVSTEEEDQSKAFYQQARNLQRNGGSLNEVIALLNQALGANRNLRAARTLRDRLLEEQSRNAVVALAPADGVVFRQAQRSYIAGRYNEANILVNRLLQNKRYLQYAPLSDLQRKVLSRI